MKLQLNIVHFWGNAAGLSEFSVSSSCLDRRTGPIEQMAVPDNCQLSSMIKALIWLICFCFARGRGSRLSDKVHVINPPPWMYIYIYIYIYIHIRTYIYIYIERERERERE